MTRVAPLTFTSFLKLFPEFTAASWDGWRAILARLDAARPREFFVIAGRGSGKSRMAAVLATAVATREHRRAPGESIYVGIFAPDRKQARITHAYVLGLLRSVPSLSALIVRATRDEIELVNGCVIEVITASTAAPRGRAYALVIVEEAAFLPGDDSAEPDVELLRAVRPALARVPGSLLCVISSPYARRGILWTAWSKYHDQPDGDVMLVQAGTLDLNPTFSATAIAQAHEEDPASASAEYDGQFRSDIESFITREAVDGCTVEGLLEVPPVAGTAYVAFIDASGGSGSDSMTMSIAHREDGLAVVDCVREVRPKFSPEVVVAEFAADVRRYGLSVATADRYGGSWVVESFLKVGVHVEPSERTKSQIYGDFIAPLNSGLIELPDLPRLHQQLLGLERKTARGGRDTIDHGPGDHDDIVNAVAGACVLALSGASEPLGVVVY